MSTATISAIIAERNYAALRSDPPSIMDRLRTARYQTARTYPRNARCPCGSGLKVKRCCASPEARTQENRS